MLELLFPSRCVVCARGGSLLCDACAHALPRIAPPLCARCGAPTAWAVERCRECAGRRLAFAQARAAFVYDAALRAYVGAWKERGLRGLAALAAELAADVLERPDVDVVTFAPPDAERRRERGHHPAERLARGLADRWSLPVEPLLVRTRPAGRQRGLDRVERRRNVRGAFAPAARPPRAVCLVDDVYTSGATAAAAASALRGAGARRVVVATLARAVRHG